MVDKKTETPVGELVQRYRFRVRTADGRELVSQIANVRRPAPPALPVQVAQSSQMVAKLAPVAAHVITAPAGKEEPKVAPAASAGMVDVPVHQILVGVKGQTQGDFHASAGFKDTPGQGPHQFPAFAFEFSIVSPRDAASGLPTGKRQYHPLVISKAVAHSTPQLYAALARNEVLETVLLDCYGTGANGKLALAHSLKLSNAALASIDLRLPNTRVERSAGLPEYEEVALTFERIEWTHRSVKVEDTWEAPVA